MKEIKIKDLTFLVDDEDFEKVKQLTWSVNNKGYATASLREGFRGGAVISMHEFVLGKAPEGFDIHHKDDTTTNNQKKNLQYLTKQQHQMLKGVQKNNASGYKGVCFDKAKGKWLASIHLDRKNIFIGRFNTAEEAARAYDKKARELFGNIAFQNFPPLLFNKELLANLSNPNPV